MRNRKTTRKQDETAVTTAGRWRQRALFPRALIRALTLSRNEARKKKEESRQRREQCYRLPETGDRGESVLPREGVGR